MMNKCLPRLTRPQTLDFFAVARKKTFVWAPDPPSPQSNETLREASTLSVSRPRIQASGGPDPVSGL